MSLQACADLVERGDADRFAAVMAAPINLRGRLWPLYAFNLEIARAPWVTKEPMIAEMRLQWWRDVVAEKAPRAHEVAGPLHDLIGAAGLDVAVLDRMAAARVWDIYSDAFEDQAAFDRYIEDSAAGLMWLAARSCGAPDQAERAVRDYGWASGLANFLWAVPGLEQRGRRPLVDGRPGAVRDLAARGLEKIRQARRSEIRLGAAAPALLAGWQAEALLRQVVADPMVVAEGRLGLSEFQRRGLLLWQGLTGRW
ncbi:phytoene synthase [Cypionkella aquatica]|uniref:Phytoene synthase n=1 Tax=Cypionkella aquatica TaxID=1756042 RepID=A0AA37TNM5_9RHOB|nr:squalene/phytoene synthase family protein [Cypionkella aquatica]GLS85049.1 phytoene synthase [Cypionkella aquatica]